MFKDHHVEKIHFLPKLLEQCAAYDNDFFKLMNIAKDLTEYAVGTRYPDEWLEFSYDETVMAISKAEQVMTFVKGKIGI